LISLKTVATTNQGQSSPHWGFRKKPVIHCLTPDLGDIFHTKIPISPPFSHISGQEPDSGFHRRMMGWDHGAKPDFLRKLLALFGMFLNG